MIVNRPFFIWLGTLLTFAAGYALGRWGFAIDALLTQATHCYPC